MRYLVKNLEKCVCGEDREHNFIFEEDEVILEIVDCKECGLHAQIMLCSFEHNV